MNQDIALRVLGQIMHWDDERTRTEFAWLSLMSRTKYDSYRDYLAGARFIEQLAKWLQQFEQGERETAYAFVRKRLVYIGTAEMEHLVELAYPDCFRPRLAEHIASELGIPAYSVWATPDATTAYTRLLKQTLFFGLSDGAHMDLFRRSNSGTISNEQIVVATEVDKKKWSEMLGELRRELCDDEARFRFIFLVDDFVGTGTTLLRKEADGWHGKLARFRDRIRAYRGTHLDAHWTLHVHHYIGTHKASQDVVTRNQDVASENQAGDWFDDVEFSFGMILPPDLHLDATSIPAFTALTDKYYDKSIETDSTRKGGADVKFGFGNCGLPLVLGHNTPNNSIALLWAETDGRAGRAMRPLFRRRHRHVQ